jgi:glycosyltransferase involved in cell wall biosynthesis
MKIALITPNFIPLEGGTEVAVLNIAKTLLCKGHKVCIITRRISGEDVRSYDDVPIHAFRTYNNLWSLIHTNIFLKSFLEKRAKDVDILHQFHLLRFGLPVSIFSRIFRKPLITTLMGTDSYDPEKKYPQLLSPYLLYLMKRSSAITSPSAELIRHAHDQGYKKEIEMIPHGISDNYFICAPLGADRLKASLFQKRPGCRLILSVQRLDPMKRVEVLIKAIFLLINKYKFTDILSIIVGDGPERGKLMKLAKDLNISEFIIFSGRINQGELPNYYRCCDIFAFHSTYETFGMVLTEAMACGRPVVSTYAGAIPEIVDHEKTGILVPPNNPEAFAKALKRLLENEQLATRMGEEGCRKARLRYRWGNICDQYLELYKEITTKAFSFG